ncbi:MAG TPA: GAF domain-containing SpoIIE family protein phosphatase, partial [Phycisphaerae bacterium]|nr:GAF domain-containing SpoIIE family protein phosphatase [Phycisphaerae bacterium]
VVDRALKSAERVLINDTAAGEIDPTMSMISNNIRSAMCVPIQYHQQVHGVIYGDRVTSVGKYTKEDADFFAALGQLAAMGLSNIKLVEEMRNRQRVEHDLHIAREIQSKLLPVEPFSDSGITIDALNDASQAISGDYFDYFLRPDGLITLVIADVSGKGTPASLLMANLQAAVHVTLVSLTDLAAAVNSLNQLVCRNVGSGRFITGIFGLLDPNARKLTYVNAGHLAPYLLRPSGFEKVQMEPSLPLGVDCDFPYEIGTLDLSPAPVTLLTFTDGIPDAENEQGESFGPQRLEDSLKANLDQPPGELVARIRRSIKQFTRNQPQTDDITLLAIQLA